MTQAGKTLVELIVVLTVIAMVSAMTGPNLSRLYSRMQLTAATDELASELRLARQLATTHRETVMAAFDLKKEQLDIRFLSGEVIHHRYYYGNKNVVIDEPSSGPEIVFYPSGRSATATTLRLHNKENQTQELTVGFTGRVNIR